MQTPRLIAAAAIAIALVVPAKTVAQAEELVPLPEHPSYQVWPGEDWPEVHPSEGFSKLELDTIVERAFAEDAPAALQGVRAVLVVRAGGIAAERYDEGFGPDSKLVSWSVGKSFTHGLTGIMVRDGKIALQDPLPVPEWQEGDPRKEITLDDALKMSTGLEFSEDYVNMATSDVIQMLFGSEYKDMGAFAASKPLIHEPGTHWYYSSGTTNMISRVLRDLSGGTEETYRAFMDAELFDPIGITSAVPEFDGAGTFIGSSLIFMTARDYARYGLLYMRDGVWNGKRILPEGWADHARTPLPTSNGQYGAHWWLDKYSAQSMVPNAKRSFPPDTFMARGHEEQSIIVVPSKDVIVVCLSLVSEPDTSELKDYLAEIVSVFPDISRRRPAEMPVEERKKGVE